MAGIHDGFIVKKSSNLKLPAILKAPNPGEISIPTAPKLKALLVDGSRCGAILGRTGEPPRLSTIGFWPNWSSRSEIRVVSGPAASPVPSELCRGDGEDDARIGQGGLHGPKVPVPPCKVPVAAIGGNEKRGDLNWGSDLACPPLARLGGKDGERGCSGASTEGWANEPGRERSKKTRRSVTTGGGRTPTSANFLRSFQLQPPISRPPPAT
jgi:hypothetical protein